jgi:CHAD domain-containing protein
MAIEAAMPEGQMIRNGRRAHAPTAGGTVTKAARRILAARLAAVRDAVPVAATWGFDIEPVHHLRVAARRATAAIDTFHDLLPNKVFRRGRKSLKRLRRAAGAARDADVFLAAVRTFAVHQSPADRPGLHFLLGHAFAAREAAQGRLVAALKAWENKAADRVSALPDRIVRDGHETVAGRALSVLPRLLKKLSSAAKRDLDDPANLHRVRVCSKRLRYAVELFVDAYPGEVRGQLLPRIEAVQDALGTANDSRQAGALLDELLQAFRRTQPALWETDRVGLEAVRSHHRQREREQRTAFWDAWRSLQALRPEVLLREPIDPARPAPGAPPHQLAVL